MQIKPFFKAHWNKLAAAVAIPTAFAAGTVTAPKEPAPFDCKGTECQVQVFIKKPSFQDAIYYKPDQWNQKTQTDIEAEEQARFDKWQIFIYDQSKLEAPPDEKKTP